jgi:hypothetical protein
VARDAPDRLLELRHREEQPVIHLRTGSQVGGEEPLLRILFREVQHDRHRFAQHEVVIDEDGDLAGGIMARNSGRRSSPFVGSTWTYSKANLDGAVDHARPDRQRLPATVSA